MKSETKEWLEIAEEDYKDSLYLFKGARHPNAVYHMCQAIEKLLKATQIEFTNKNPRKTHYLELIARKTGLDFTKDQYLALEDLSKHYRRIRYPDYQRALYNTKAKVQPIINQGKEIYQWVLTKLKNL
jgi:HEPN domain-containing protein